MLPKMSAGNRAFAALSYILPSATTLLTFHEIGKTENKDNFIIYNVLCLAVRVKA